LVSGTRNFELRVDPTHRAVMSGLNFAYVNAYDSSIPSAPPLFQFPITLIKPMAKIYVASTILCRNYAIKCKNKKVVL